MPKKWRNNWAPCETEEHAKKHDSCLLTLGNLAIIPQPLNASIRDANWAAKKAGKGTANPGLELCASGLLTIHNVLKGTEWTKEKKMLAQIGCLSRQNGYGRLEVPSRIMRKNVCRLRLNEVNRQ